MLRFEGAGAQIELFTNQGKYENKVYVLPKHLDEKVAALHLDAGTLRSRENYGEWRMAHIDDLLNHVPDTDLRKQLRAAVGEIRDRRQFEIVYESHIPETVALSGMALKPRSVVLTRRQMSDDPSLVESIDGATVFLPMLKDGQQDLCKYCRFVCGKTFR